MPPPGWSPPASERALGLGFYATVAPGAGGGLKESPDDFRVREISAYPRPDPDGPYTVMRVESRDREQHELAQAIAQTLGLPPHAIDWAGTKDRRAVAERLLSYRGAPPTSLSLSGVRLLDAYRARSGLVLGHHFGNSFNIRVPLEAEHHSELPPSWGLVTEELRRLGGVPNLFGPQRFGEVRPVTHVVGRHLVRGDPAAAVESYLTDLPEGESAPGAEARRAYRAHHDPARALREFPAGFRFERTLLDQLARGRTPTRAIGALSRELRQLFVHAYQSLLFNRWAGQRWERGISLVDPEPGDVLLRVARDGTMPGNAPVPVAEDNLSECRDLVRRERARVAGALVGYETPTSRGRPAELLEAILQEEGLTRDAFRLPATPDVASAGTFRALTIPVPPIGIRADRDPGRRPGAWFTFGLPKGAYATVLLREYLKLGASASS